MLHWCSATNFKSVGDTQALQLAPLTVLAGANNSGKSSLLQALLIMAQTLRSSTDDPALVLDGELFQRGEAQELVHFGRRTVSFAFEADVDSKRLGREATLGWRVRVGLTFRLSGGPAWEKRFQVASSSLTVLDSEGQTVDTIRVQRRRGSWQGPVGTEPPPWLAGETLQYRLIEGRERYRNVLGVSLWHFLPQWMIQRLDARSARYQELLRHIVTRRPPIREDPSLAEEALALARLLLKDPQVDSLDKLTFKQRNALRADFGTAAPRRALALFEALRGDYRWRRIPLAGVLEESITSLRAFARSVRHLGPLRLPPRLVYASVPSGQEGAVGSAGELTVAELNRSGNAEVDTINPQTGDTERVTLQIAVATWLRYMGIVEQFVTGYRPKIGHYLFVRPPQLSEYVDLTSVGVGASQVLPVLVQALIAPPGSVLVFEQPELHLHPKVQSILADFFIGLARTGRQCLVETHSEHIVNRIRFRIAEADTPDLLSLTRIYFVERANGQSRFRPVAINEYGALEDWPAGFFDETHLEAERILRSAIRKRSGRES
jgi:predicted ATPase